MNMNSSASYLVFCLVHRLLYEHGRDHMISSINGGILGMQVRVRGIIWRLNVFIPLNTIKKLFNACNYIICLLVWCQI